MNLFNAKCDILEQIVYKGEDMSPTVSEHIRYEDLPCRISWTKSSDVVIQGRIVNARDAKLYCQYKPDIETTDIVEHNDKYYRIVGIKPPSVPNHHLELEIKLDTER